jgi:hypothetical protein
MKVIKLMLEQDPDCQDSQKWRRAVGRSQSILRFISEYPKEITVGHRRELLGVIITALGQIIDKLTPTDRRIALCSNDQLVLGDARSTYGYARSVLQYLEREKES